MTETPETLRELMLEMHDAIWGPYVVPEERQEQELDWLRRLHIHILAWQASERRLAEAEPFVNYASRVLSIERDALVGYWPLGASAAQLEDTGAAPAEGGDDG